MLASKIVEKAMRKAQGAQVSIDISDVTEVSYEHDRLKKANSSQKSTCVLKVIVNEKVGTSRTTDLNGDIDGVVDRALDAAAFGSKAHFVFPGPSDAKEVKIYDDAVLSVSREEMVDVGRNMVDVIKDYNKDILVYAGVEKRVSTRFFANSAGAAFKEERTGYSVRVGGELVRGTDILWAGHGFGWCKRDIAHETIALKAVDLFRKAERIVSVNSGEMPVIFMPEGVIVIFLALQLGFNGKNVFLGSSPLKNKLRKKIADERICIKDDPMPS